MAATPAHVAIAPHVPALVIADPAQVAPGRSGGNATSPPARLEAKSPHEALMAETEAAHMPEVPCAMAPPHATIMPPNRKR
jgi:hypothetical protein